MVNEKPQGIINIVDATNIERNLYLTMQLIELGIPMVLALNMMDEMRANGNTVHVNHLRRRWASRWCPSRPPATRASTN